MNSKTMTFIAIFYLASIVLLFFLIVTKKEEFENLSDTQQNICFGYISYPIWTFIFFILVYWDIIIIDRAIKYKTIAVIPLIVWLVAITLRLVNRKKIHSSGGFLNLTFLDVWNMPAMVLLAPFFK